MRYTEAKDRSAELLRLALAQMGRHAAAFNPITFAIWYEYSAGINPRLNGAIDQLLADATSLNDECVARLYAEHIAPADESTMQRISGEFQRLIGSIADTASLTGDRAGRFGAQLDDLSAALLTHDMDRLSPQLNEALAGTAEMKSSAEALQQQVVSSQGEIAKLRSDLDRARGEALTDPLTGILNRKGFDQQIEALIKQAPDAGRVHCLVMLDIDHFKKVNDSHGHVMGDRVIQGLGEILRLAVSEAGRSAARYGGEEFALMLPHCTVDEAFGLAELVRARAKAMKIRNRTTQEVMFSITVSGGVAALKADDDAAGFIARADAALYKSKHGGRDRVTRA
ncbi:MAG TPA: GGDEF domain-containing protein [Burkholderiaceae bacterium]|jgi:diguanylate cyclase